MAYSIALRFNRFLGFVHRLLFWSDTIATEQLGLTVTLQTCIQEVLGSNLGRDTGYTVLIHPNFPHSLQAKDEVEFQLGHDRFLPNSFQ
jgi:hypothetical protein